MAIPAFSAAWAAALRDAVNSDLDFREIGRKWSEPVALIVHDHERLPGGAAVEVVLDAGNCTAAESLEPGQVSAPYVLSAALETWREIVEGSIDPITAVIKGVVSVVRGSKTTLMLNARTARALLATTQKIDTLWP